MKSRCHDFPARSRILLAVFAVFFFTEACFLVYYGITVREESRNAARRIAWKQAEIPAVSGSVFAPDGTVLCHSELICLLYWTSQHAKQHAEQSLGREISPEEELSASDILSLEPVLQKFPYELSIQSREQRFYSSSKSLDRIERKYHEVLQGKPGLFVVMLDRSGRWVPGTVKMIRKPIPGQSVRLTDEEYAGL